MKRLFLAAAMTAFGVSAIQGAPLACSTLSTLRQYMDLANGCNLGDATVSGFTFVVLTGNQVTIDPVNISVTASTSSSTPLGTQLLFASNYFSVTNGLKLRYDLSYTFTSPVPNVAAAGMTLSGVTLNGTFSNDPNVRRVYLDTNYFSGELDFTNELTSTQSTITRSAAFDPIVSGGDLVVNHIKLRTQSGAGNSASFTSFSNDFLVTPEPSGWILSLSGLGVAGFWLSRLRGRSV